MTESVEFSTLYTKNELAPARTLDVIREEWLQIIIGAFTPLASLALFHMVTVFPLSWIVLNSSEHLVPFIVIEIIAAIFGLVAILASGPIADRIGRRRLLWQMAIAIAVFAVVSPLLLGRGGNSGRSILRAYRVCSAGFVAWSVGRVPRHRERHSRTVTRHRL